MRSTLVNIFLGWILGTVGALGQSHYPGQHLSKMIIPDTSHVKIKAFDLQDIRLLPSRFTDNCDRESKWIMSIGVNSLLHSFRTNAGIASGIEGGYDSIHKLAGWESLDCELRGHTTGHILSGLALLYASTGNKAFKLRGDSLVEGLASVQKALNQDGYLSAFPQSLIDRNMAGQKVWAPWYTLHKILSGLLDQYLYCDNQTALDVAKKMGDWARRKLAGIAPEQRKVMIRNEFGGINDSFYMLYELTGNEDYKWLARFFYHDENLDPLQSGIDNLNKKHANTFIPKLTGIIRGYEVGEPAAYKDVSNFFWNTVVSHHTFCTGSNSDRESFFEPDHQADHLTGYTGESCNVYNLLKLTRHLYCLDGNVKYAEYYEKALYNHILGQQDPATGMISYFLPMLPGGYKVYSTPDSSFWCCVGTGFENQAKYGEAIYYHNDNRLYVNLLIPSELNWKEKGVKIIQQTRFPVEGRSTLLINLGQPEKLVLNLRYPAWATSGAIIKLNGKRIMVNQKPASYLAIDRTWKNGDQLEVEYPMSVKEVPTQGNPEVVTLEFGPVVLAARMGTEGMKKPAPYSNPRLHNDYYTYQYNVPADISNELSAKGKPVDSWLKRAGGQSLTFISDVTASGKQLTFVPLFDLHRERYNVYWKLK